MIWDGLVVFLLGPRECCCIAVCTARNWLVYTHTRKHLTGVCVTLASELVDVMAIGRKHHAAHELSSIRSASIDSNSSRYSSAHVSSFWPILFVLSLPRLNTRRSSCCS